VRQQDGTCLEASARPREGGEVQQRQVDGRKEGRLPRRHQLPPLRCSQKSRSVSHALSMPFMHVVMGVQVSPGEKIGREQHSSLVPARRPHGR
jgi:hypothetical protein